MKKARKILLTLCAALLLVSLSVGATIAYLTDSASVKNTFTVGDVEITLKETKTDENGDPVKVDGEVQYITGTKDGTEVGNKYHLLPKSTYTKDPTITVVADSEDCYVRAIVTVTYDVKADEVLAQYMDQMIDRNTTAWTWTDIDYNVDEDTATAVYEVRYNTIVENNENADQPLPALFTKITIPEALTNEQIATLADLSIAVEANAIQANGFENDVDAAWEAFKK